MESSENGKGGIDMKKRLTNNLSLKIISVVIAVCIWLFASNANDPVDIKSYAVKVNVINDEYIYNSGQTYQIADEDRTVMVYITGKSSVISNRTDITVEADMTQIVDKSTNPAYVPVQFKTVSGISAEDVNIIPKTIPVYIEDVKTKDFMVTVNTTGKQGSGYEIGECTPALEKISIRGPKSTINKIKSVVASVNVTGMMTDEIKKADLKIYDQNGTELTSDQLEYLTLFNIGEDRTIDVSVKLWRIVDNIKVKARYSGTPAYGYQVDKVTTTPETISVAGSEEALRRLKDNNNTIEIPSNLIDVSGLSQDVDASIKLNSLLKEEDGYKIPEELTQSVMVKVSILPYGSKEFEVKTSDIEVNDLGENLRLGFNQDTVTVRVKATQTELSSLTADQIKVSIDLKDKLAGEYTLPVTVTLPDGYEQVETTVTTVQLTKVENAIG